MEQSYKEKYEQALAKAKEQYNYPCMRSCMGILEEIFPELAESGDEKIRKRLITDFGTIGKKEWGGLEVKDILAWLEKQGESSICNIPSKEIILAIWDLGNEWKELTGGSISTEYGTQLKYIQNHWHESEYYLRAMQNEQKLIDKVEPKFREGEWITNGDYTWIIVGVKPLDYVLQSQDGNIVDDTISHVDEQFHFFTIADAKDGDVLYINNTVSESIMIYKSFNNGIIKKYASYNKFGFEGEHYLTLNDGYITPTTKEQRDTLLKAMADAGYTFDFERKELKKIEPKTKENKGNIGGIPANWSEKDNWYVEDIISLLDFGGSIHTKEQIQDWLRSLQDRVQPQNKWKPSVEQMDTLWFYAEQNNYDGAVLTSLYNDLKKLKEE